MSLRALTTLAIPMSAAGMAVGYGSAFLHEGPPAWGVWVFVVSMALLLTAVMAVGALRPRARRGELAVLVALAGMFVVLAGAFGAVLVLPPDAPADALWLGLPRRAAIVLYGVGVVPLFALPLVYALTFERLTLSEEDLARVRAARVQANAASRADAP